MSAFGAAWGRAWGNSWGAIAGVVASSLGMALPEKKRRRGSGELYQAQSEDARKYAEEVAALNKAALAKLKSISAAKAAPLEFGMTAKEMADYIASLQAEYDAIEAQRAKVAQKLDDELLLIALILAVA